MGWKKKLAKEVDAANAEILEQLRIVAESQRRDSRRRIRVEQKHREEAKQLRKDRQARGAWEVGLGLIAIVAAGVLALEYLQQPLLRDEAEEAVGHPNTLVIEYDAALEVTGTVSSGISETEESFWVSIDPVVDWSNVRGPGARNPDFTFTLSYDGQGFAGGGEMRCVGGYESAIDVENQTEFDVVLPNDGTPVDLVVELEDIGEAQLGCLRTDNVAVHDSRGEFYLYPTVVTMISRAPEPDSELRDSTSEYEAYRTLNLKSTQTWESEMRSVTWVGRHLAMLDGVLNFEFDEGVTDTPVIAVTGEHEPMRIIDAEVVAEIERKAWIAALVAGLGFALLINGAFILGADTLARWRSKRANSQSV